MSKFEIKGEGFRPVNVHDTPAVHSQILANVRRYPFSKVHDAINLPDFCVAQKFLFLLMAFVLRPICFVNGNLQPYFAYNVTERGKLTCNFIYCNTGNIIQCIFQSIILNYINKDIKA